MPRGLFGWLGQVVAWLVILCVVLVLAAAVLIPRLAGATPYTVLTGSMRPAYPPGTLVVVKPTDAGAIGAGTVVTYQLESGKPAVVTHRVVEVRTTVGGETTFITRGDANGVADSEPVRPVQIKGKLWYSIPYLGYVNNALTGNQRQWAVYGVGGGLVLYAGYMFTSATRDRRRNSSTVVTDQQKEDIAS